jgi:pyruvate formate-lyase/glycerol dehydratase family glycyl radical enzyme
MNDVKEESCRREQRKNRIESLKKQLINSKPNICPERAILLTEFYKNNEDMPIILKRARALRYILNHMSIYISDRELIVGNQASSPRSAPLFPEFSWEWIYNEVDTFPIRKSDKFGMSKETRDHLKRILPWWKGKTVEEKSIAAMPAQAMQAHEEFVYILTSLSSGIGHICIDYSRVLSIGISGIKKIVLKKIAMLDNGNHFDLKRREFYEAANIVCESVIEFANRFSKLARKMSENESNLSRKRELENISHICSKVPKNPPDSFYEAVQSFWFIHLLLQIESNGHSISPGRFDQYMYPFYKNDIKKKVINRDFVKEILGCLWIKFNEIIKVRNETSSLAFGGYPMFQNLILGGVNKIGRDATNELSYLCLEITNEVKLPQPSLSVRYHNECPDNFLMDACKLSRTGLGMPAFFNDEVIIPILLSIGCTLKEARNYAEVGCVEPQCPGKTEGYYCGGYLNICKILEITLNNGINSHTGHKVGLEVGTDFATFKEFKGAFKKQIKHFIDLQVIADNSIDTIHQKFAPTPFLSLFVSDCIEKGLDIREGGAKYNYTSPNAVGLANVGDALAVIDTVVHKEKKLSYEELRKILSEDYKDNEVIRGMFLNKIPKYGNDNDYVDNFVSEVADYVCTEFSKMRNIRGGYFQPGLQSISAHALFAGTLGATPDGRKAEMLLADGGVSAAQGRDKNGPTSLMKSVSKIDHFKAINGALLNIKFNPDLLKDDQDIQNMMLLIKGFFFLKGQHVQFNVISSTILREAQIHPERYSNLVVRVAGFSVFFTDVDKTLQDDIIARTEQMNF